MIEAIVPRKTVAGTEAGREEPRPMPAIIESLQEQRAKQYQTIEQLCAMRTVLTGEDLSGTLEKLSEPPIDTLMKLTATICEQGCVIDQLVKECRELIGA